MSHQEIIQLIRRERLIRLQDMAVEMGISYSTFEKLRKGRKISELNQIRVEKYLEQQLNILKP